MYLDLLDCIIEHIPAPKTAEGSPAQMQVTSLDFLHLLVVLQLVVFLEEH
jgi:predicted membrane GTPase involved in stress response